MLRPKTRTFSRSSPEGSCTLRPTFLPLLLALSASSSFGLMLAMFVCEGDLVDV